MGCGGSSREKPWATYKGLRDPITGAVLEKTPMGNGCADCWHIIIDGAAPRTFSSWNDAEAWLLTPDGQTNFPTWKARAEGERRNFLKSGVAIVTKVGMRYEATLEPILLTDLEQDHPGVNFRRVQGLHVEQIMNHKKEMVDVVLVRSDVPDRVIMYTTSEGQYTEHFLRPENQLRKGQGPEFWRQISEANLRHRPRADVPTREGLLALLPGRQPMAPSAPGPAPRRGESEDRLAVRPAIPTTWLTGMGESPEPPQAEPEGLETEAAGEGGDKGGKRRGGRGRDALLDSAQEPKRPRRSGGGSSSVAGQDRPGRGPARSAAEETAGDVAAITVEAILEGQFDMPKRKAQHRIMSLENVARTGTAVVSAQANAEISALKAAVFLTPPDLPKLTDDVLMPNLNTVIGHLGEKRLPLLLRVGLCRRTALLHVESPADCVRAIWPFPGPTDLGAPPAFDPFQPRAWCLMEDDTRTTLLEAAVKLLSEDCLASLMSKRKTAEIQELARLLEQSGPVFPQGHAPQDLRVLCVAVAAMVQTTAIDAVQLSAMLALKDGTREIFRNMGPVLSDGYWIQLQADAWRFASHESTMTPAMVRTHEAFRQLPPGGAQEGSAARGALAPAASAARVAHWESPWATLEAALPKWRSLCRPGATAPVTRAAAAAATAAVSEIAATTAQVAEDMTIMETWRSRAAWLTSELTSSGLAADSPELRELTGASRAADLWLEAATAQVMLSRGAVAPGPDDS